MTSLILIYLLQLLIRTGGQIAPWLSSQNFFSGKTTYCTVLQHCTENWKNPEGTLPLLTIACNNNNYQLVQLTPTYKTALYPYSISAQGRLMMSIDFFFLGTWSNSDYVNISTSTWQDILNYSDTQPFFTASLCNNQTHQVKQFSSMLPPGSHVNLRITAQSTNGILVLRNIHLSSEKCHPSCAYCNGPLENQCTSCAYGSPINGTCSPCPPSLPFRQSFTCVAACYATQTISQNKECIQFGQTSYIIFTSLFSINSTLSELRFWAEIYDPLNVDGSTKASTISLSTYYIGPFKGTAGLTRPFQIYNSISPQNLYRLDFTLILCGTFEDYGGIQFKVNKIYNASVYFLNQQIQSHSVIVYQISTFYQPCNSFPNHRRLYGYITFNYTLPSAFTLTIQGNFTPSSLGTWGLSDLRIQSLSCSSNCRQCNQYQQCYLGCSSSAYTLDNVNLQCNSPIASTFSCQQNSFFHNFQCIYNTSEYSKYLVQAFNTFSPFAEMNSIFTLVNQTGSNFAKGENAYTSYNYQRRVFGGPYVWAQAAFNKSFSTLDPHFSVVVRFNLITGWNFSGQFKYRVHENPVVTLSSNMYNATQDLWDDSNQEYIYYIYQVVPHDTLNFEVEFECLGENNNVIDSYCSISDFFVILNKCQPFCDACTGSNSCTAWNSTYDSQQITFTSASCLTHQYYSSMLLKCIDCDTQKCLTCTSFEYCLTCKPPFIAIANQCICSRDYFLDTDLTGAPTCTLCPDICLTCASATYCYDCHPSHLRIHFEGQCLCKPGYYDANSSFNDYVCQPCYKFCTQCTSYENGYCHKCIEKPQIVLQNGFCSCQDGLYFEEITQACTPCHPKCKTCSGPTPENCLSCDSGIGLVLQGLKCVCSLGTHSQIIPNTCTTCPSTETPSYQECYKNCPESAVWFNIPCANTVCPAGYNFQNSQCEPICGDGQVNGYEVCDDNNNVEMDGCFNCMFQCPQACGACNQDTIFPCVPICGDSIVSGDEQCDDGNQIMYDGCHECKFQCEPQCTKCIGGKCYECGVFGWKVNVANLTCIENCSDTFVVNREECDDGNLLPNDGCDGNCRWRCRDDCLECSIDRRSCLSCPTGFFPQLYYCRNICGDNLQVSSAFNVEECDDGNTISLDGCSSNCLWQCQSTSICTSCVSNKCQTCAIGYSLNQGKNKCEPICGDQLIVLNEICDDSNSLMYDGCYRCQYQCSQYCSSCNIGKCQACNLGFLLNRYNNRCEPICGNRIVQIGEECDDGNNIFDDGCFNCRYTCQDSCLNCLQGKCFLCDAGYTLNMGRCQPICGDGILTKQEECEPSLTSSQQICKQCKLICLDGTIQIISSELSLVSFAIVEFCIYQIGQQCRICANGWEYEEITNTCMSLRNKLHQSCLWNCQLCDDESGTCIECQEGFVFQAQTNSCEEVCGNGVQTFSEECDITTDYCINCHILCGPFCQICIKGQCIQFSSAQEEFYQLNSCFDEDFTQTLTGNDYFDQQIQVYNPQLEQRIITARCSKECETGCASCDFGICLQCAAQHQFDFTNQCQLIFAEDQNEQCDINCELCNYGICLKCRQGWYLNVLSDCISICSDAIVPSLQPLDPSLPPGLDEYICRSCPPYCIACSLGLCITCEAGYYIDEYSNQCVSFCGDKIVASDEECDDDNSLIDDGCYSCLFTCQQGCLQCIQGNCLSCQEGYALQLVQQQCIPQQQPPSKPKNCLQSVNFICNQCQRGYELDLYSNSCSSKCGNFEMAEDEECDDPTDYSCLNCQLVCQTACTICIQGMCQQCQIGWILEFSQCILDRGQSNLVAVREDFGYSPTKFAQDTLSCYPLYGKETTESVEQCDEYYDASSQSPHFFACEANCFTCLKGVCLQCARGWQTDPLLLCYPIRGDGEIVGPEKCDSPTQNFQHTIPNLCQVCPVHCITCDVNYVCSNCESGFFYNQVSKECVPLCGDLVIAGNEECEDGNNEIDDNCFACRFQCHQGCLNCQQGVCLGCANGWYEEDEKCVSKCGDGIKTSLEQCDDGNDVSHDGCYECEFSCQLECFICYMGRCELCSSGVLVPSTKDCQKPKECETYRGYYLDRFDNKCKPMCGDKIVAEEEECDDGNEDPLDGCFKCSYQCDLNCTFCDKGVCLSCVKGYHPLGAICILRCGDGIQVPKEEMCDDGNQFARDGCTKCQVEKNTKCLLTPLEKSICWKCSENCADCSPAACLVCNAGYTLKNGFCKVCDEKCIECTDQPTNCTLCVFPECKPCEKELGFYSDYRLRQCYTKCGDNYLTPDEQCDDGNRLNKDGCSSDCKIEEGYQCDKSGCKIPVKPLIEVDFKNSTTKNDLYLVLPDDIDLGACSKLKVWIEQFEETEFKMDLLKNSEGNGCDIGFEFYKTIDEFNLIHILVPQSLSRNESMLLSESTEMREVIVKPRRKVYYSDAEKAQAQTVVAVSNTMSLVLILIGPMTIILGGFNFFWTILDILTWINNFYFLNVDYPENVRLFFQKLEWGDIFMIPDIFTLNSEDDEYYFEAPPKFKDKDVDPLFANNIQLFVGLIGLSVVGYLFSTCFLRLYNLRYKKQSKKVFSQVFSVSPIKKTSKLNQLSFPPVLQKVQSTASQIVPLRLQEEKKVPFVLQKIYQETFYFSRHYKSKVFQILGLVFLDLCLASALQITNTQTDQFLMIKLNILAAALNFILIGFNIYVVIWVSRSHTVLMENKHFAQDYGSLYEGINQGSIVAKNYCAVNLMRKSLFIFFTVYYYTNPLMQTSTCCISCFINIALLCYENPFTSYGLLVQNGVPDLCIFIIILLTVVLAIDDQSGILAKDEKMMIGWGILALIGISILVQVAFLLQQFFQDLKDRFSWLKSMLIGRKTQPRKAQGRF